MPVSPTDATPPSGARPALETTEQWARFLSGFVHELKTPLASLGMIAELLDKGGCEGLGSNGKRYTGNLRELTHDLQVVVQDAGTLARLLEGRRVARREALPVADSVGRVAEAARSRGWERGLSLVTTLAPDLPATVTSDRGLFEEALGALLETAIALAEQEVALDVRSDGETLAVTVTPDTGCGPEEGPEALLGDPFGGGTARLLRQKGVRPLAPLLAREAARLLGGGLTMVAGDGRTRCVLCIPLR